MPVFAEFCWTLWLIVVPILFLRLEFAVHKVGATTDARDIEALTQIKAAVDPSTITSFTCLASWEFSADPCDAIFGSYFVCGIQCGNGGAGSRRVVSLTLDSSGYKGTLSPYIGNLSALQELKISGNVFSGTIPRTLGQLSNLNKLDLSDNALLGLIPDSLGQLSSLSYLSLANNMLEGPIPGALGNLHNLQRLSLYNNKLDGNIPPLIKLQQLSYFDASRNFLSGPISSVFDLPASIISLSLGCNLFGGNIPKSLSTLDNLEVLDLSSNFIAGCVQKSVFELSSLQQLNLSHNRFTSISVPDLSGLDSQLVAVDISYNDIRGSLPVLMANMTKLSALSMRYNRLTGNIPYEYGNKANASFNSLLTGVRPLLRLLLDGNFLTGEVPAPFLGLAPDHIKASFIFNCLQSCPSQYSFCQGGSQRPLSECANMSY
ncbi:hypothetical protein O6H91_04G089900 [Diphasiastrum complanatum]|uniref:Uncharacterized protein n=3 Tax=Diphasiastrum complanatum TaxID=34168 RepID=A0ACC2DZB1_DIPCM|nr:hypothetical protein O6H91_04G089900 [Diphasiastrum complanatum]KAJ7559540.1 hypothetical protein O6H91_04G089900 [Diphasiastrum complanatum]KAJ7559541.1 hypothetical protein O6H91_04G089900 [Diphasiastrum complanatum]